jgi:hypothetical protein
MTYLAAGVLLEDKYDIFCHTLSSNPQNFKDWKNKQSGK